MIFQDGLYSDCWLARLCCARHKTWTWNATQGNKKLCLVLEREYESGPEGLSNLVPTPEWQRMRVALSRFEANWRDYAFNREFIDTCDALRCSL